MKILNEREIENIKVVIAQMREKERRQFLYRKADELGRGGLSYVRNTFQISYESLYLAKTEIDNNDIWMKDSRDRAKGAGRKCIEAKYPYIHEMVLIIVDPTTYGIPTKTLKWTTLSLRKIVDELEKHGVSVSHTTIKDILEQEGYSRQRNMKAEQVGEPDPDRNEQFLFIDSTANEFLQAGDPVISVDTKKKENIGNFANNGTEYRKKGDPRRTLDHDFPIEKLGKVAPYGVYCLNDNTGFINLGTDHDTSEFAMVSILQWWIHIGKVNFPNSKRILITCDCGGSNRASGQQWKEQLFIFSVLTTTFPNSCTIHE